MCHNPAILFDVEKRIYQKVFMRLVILTSTALEVSKDNLLYKCNWSPLKIRHLNLEYYTHWLTVILFLNGKIIESGRE